MSNHDKVPGERWPISRIARLWANEIAGDYETIAAVLYLHARGDFANNLDPNLARFFNKVSRSCTDIPEAELHNAEYYIQKLRVANSKIDHEVTIQQLQDFCETHRITYPGFLPASLWILRAKAHARTVADRKQQTTKATQAVVATKQLRLERLIHFLEDMERQARDQGYKPISRRSIPVTKADLHKVFFRVNGDLKKVTVRTLADDLRDIGARFDRGTKNNKKQCARETFPQREIHVISARITPI